MVVAVGAARVSGTPDIVPAETGCEEFFSRTARTTSAASERVFSLLEGMFGKDQDTSLSDIIQGALMLRYNERKVG